MRCLLLELTSLLLLGVIFAQRQVTVQDGPLYRTENSHITIWCKVSGYQGPSEQNFQWSIYLPSAPEREVQIVSTMDQSFPYAIYTQRVRSGEIYVEKVQGDSALLHITELQDRDAGEYECHTPTTDERYFGSYSAKMKLVVIPDSLRVTSEAQTLNKVQHDSLELKCEISKSTAQHSHISIAWYRKKGDELAVEVISLSRDFVLRAGSDYTQRHASGDIRLDKIGETLSKLTIYNLQSSDGGEFYCEAAEWIQDPDGTWYAMTRKRSEGTMVYVEGTDMDINVRLETEKRTYTVGEPVEFRCILEVQNVAKRYFSISWAFNSSLIATFGANAVPVLNNEFAQRESLGQLKVAKESDSVYILKIYRLRLEDSGKYNCRVTERLKTTTGEFIDGESKRPKNTPITVLPLKTNISVDVSNNATSVLEGESLRFGCSVRTGFRPQNRLSVTWQLVDKQNRRSDIVQLDRDGTLRPGPSYAERSSYGGIQMEQIRPGSFTLEIFNSLKADEGHYECRITEWTRRLDGEWQMIGERHNGSTVSITALDAGFAVTAISRTPGVTYNESFDLQCIIKPHYPSWVPVSVTWRFQPAGSTEFHDLVTFTRDGGVQWGDRYTGFRTRTAIEKSESSNNVRLSISRASDTEAGKYQCVAELWRKNYNSSWTRLADRTSNLLEIRVLRPVTKLQVSKSKRSITLVENGPIPLNCSVKSQTSPDSHFAVLWYVHKLTDTDGRLILKTTHSSVFEYGTYAEEEGLKGRLQFERSLSGGLFSLTVQRAQVSDSGSYYCHVEEWLLNPNHAWYKLAEEVSGRTEVTVKLPGIFPIWLILVHLKKFYTKFFFLLLPPFTHSSFSCCLVPDMVWSPGFYSDVPSPFNDRKHFWLKDHLFPRQEEEKGSSLSMFQKSSDVALQVDTTTANITVPEQGHFHLDCNILSLSSRESRFAVTWFSMKTKERGGQASRKSGEERETLLKIGQDSIFSREANSWEGRLRFQRLSATLYRLTVLQAGAVDTGNYSCRVEEWLPNPRGMWYKLAQEDSGPTSVYVQDTGSSLQSVICSNDSLFYFVFFYPFPIFGILIITILLVRFKSRNSSKNSEGKNGAPLLWIKEPHLNYSPTCLEPPVLSIHPGTID
uniref:Immunoglobulin superfamily member 3 n=1 Tax=Anolis carolinensis TaxID=28377 RepID=A0A803U106_ANOCA